MLSVRSYQLVLGDIPNLPNTMTRMLPALQGAITSEILKHHLGALNSARKVFIKFEADQKIVNCSGVSWLSCITTAVFIVVEDSCKPGLL